jgi:hypothetical protein
MKMTGQNRSTGGKTCHSVTLSTTNPTWTDPGSNPGIRGERPATNRLSHGTALKPHIIIHTIKIVSHMNLYTYSHIQSTYTDTYVAHILMYIHTYIHT